MENGENKQQGTWNEWRLKVLSDIKELKEVVEALQERIKELEIKLAVLNAKAAMYGAGAGIVVTAVFGAIAKGLFNA